MLAYLLADQPSLVRSMVVRPRTANWRAGKLFSLFCLYVKRLRSITCGRFQHCEMGRSCTVAKQMPCRADWALLLQLCSFAPVRERPREAEESVRSSSLPPFLSLLLFPWRGFSGPRPSLPFFPFFFSFCPFLSSYFLQNVLKSKISVNLYSFVWKRANALPSASRPVAKFLSFPSFSRKSLEIF